MLQCMKTCAAIVEQYNIRETNGLTAEYYIVMTHTVTEASLWPEGSGFQDKHQAGRRFRGEIQLCITTHGGKKGEG